MRSLKSKMHECEMMSLTDVILVSLPDWVVLSQLPCGERHHALLTSDNAKQWNDSFRK